MVAAKLDQSRVLETKFHQNRLTLKGRSAGQRHTDRQTNSAENNGPSGLQSGKYKAINTGNTVLSKVLSHEGSLHELASTLPLLF